MVAKGAILRAIQKDLIGERYLRRSIGIGWDEEFDKKKHHKNNRTIDVHDGAETVQDCVHWLFRLVSTLQDFDNHPIVITHFL